MLLHALVWLFSPFLLTENKGELVLHIKNLDTPKGVIRVAVYDDEKKFLQTGNETLGKIIPVHTAEELQVNLLDLRFGYYAIAIYHDVNDNGALDKNYLNIPTEPYAFSNNPAVKWRSPTFQETQIEFSVPQKELTLELKRWRKH